MGANIVRSAEARAISRKINRVRSEQGISNKAAYGSRLSEALDSKMDFLQEILKFKRM